MEEKFNFNGQLLESFSDEEGKSTYRFIVNEESINSKAWKVLNDGFQFDAYMKNHPLVFWNHPFHQWAPKAEDILPVGKFTNMFKQGKQTLGDIQFNGTTEMSKVLEELYSSGELTNSSITMQTDNFDTMPIPKKLAKKIKSEDGNYRVANTSDLFEFSLVPMGANKNTTMKKIFSAMGMPDENMETEINHTIKLNSNLKGNNLNIDIIQQPEGTEMKIEEIQEKLSISEEEVIALKAKIAEGNTQITEQEVNLTTLKTQNEELTAKIAELEAETNCSETENFTAENNELKARIQKLEDEKITAFHSGIVKDAIDNLILPPVEKDHKLTLLASLSAMENDEVYKAELSKLTDGKPMEYLKVPKASTETDKFASIDLGNITIEQFTDQNIKKQIVDECHKRASENNTDFMTEFSKIKKQNNL